VTQNTFCQNITGTESLKRPALMVS